MLKLVEAMCDEAQLATKSKSVFLSYMSHEIRTPINAVLGMNEMILRECEDEQILTYADNIKSSGKTLLLLINDILDMSKIESGRMDIVPTEYETADIIIDLWNIIYLRAQEKGLKVDFILDETMPRKLYGDDVRIKQIVTNLLTNAVKYTPEGSVELHAAYKKTGADRIDLIISVKDTGMGIKQEDMEKLFEDFKRLDEEKNRNIEGTGLGMTITKSLLNLMEGKIDVESEYQKGSTFIVTIPQKVLSDEPTGDFASVMGRQRSESIHKKGSFEAPEAKVLVVDDNNMNLLVFKALLKRTKMNIATADSGKKCLELVKKDSFHIIFMDHMMPDMDGVETLHEIRKLTDSPNVKTPVIALTGNALSGAKEFYLQEGFTDFVTKPVEGEQLERMIVSYLPEELVQMQKKEQGGIKQAEVQETVSKDDSKNEKFLRLEEKGFHTKKGMIYCSDDEKYYEEMLLQFAKEAESKITNIQTLFQEENIKNYQINVHDLKSASKMLGADTLSEMAKDAEKAARNQDIAYIKENHQGLIDKYRETVRDILDVLDQR
ncbi:MAG: response regulator, partial [Lachnospiraceae bacterium]|nr:response regulator [Lachnospiraceae bacterium]